MIDTYPLQVNAILILVVVSECRHNIVLLSMSVPVYM